MSAKDGGPAFPSPIHPFGGMGTDGCVTVRDYFAAAALQGLMNALFTQPAMPVEGVAETCYRYADVMLAERAK